MNRHFLIALLAACAPGLSAAADGTLKLGANIASIGVIEGPIGSHRPPDFEVEIRGGFTPPPGVNCPDRTYLTTLASTDDRGWLLRYLEIARWGNSTLAVTITDDPTLQAFPGRCSIKAMSW